jgi:CO/xanthine dehydrogenase Mo-binding subunit
MQLRVDETSGVIALQKVFAVVDAGLIVNPDGARAQIEGGIIQSASWTLKEQLVFSRSEIQSRDWLSYPILGFEEIPDIHVEEIPDIHVEIVDQKKRQSLGVGEVAQGPTAAAIANAVFHATGSRLRDLPLTLGA